MIKETLRNKEIVLCCVGNFSEKKIRIQSVFDSGSDAEIRKPLFIAEPDIRA